MSDESVGTWHIWRREVGHSELGPFVVRETSRIVETVAGYGEQQVDDLVKQWCAMRWNETTDYLAERII